jgi:hypothetical protein
MSIPKPRSLRAPIGRRVLAGLAAAAVLAGPMGVAADDYDPQRAGHPVRMIAYALHPVGVIVDLLVLRPAHWIGSLPVLDEFFGHEPYDD